MTIHRAALLVAVDHPSIAGHFPDNPIVPGVILLDHVQRFAEETLGIEYTRTEWSHVKFLRPLRPGHAAHVELEPMDGGCVRFRVLTDETLVASGQLSGSFDR